MKLLSLLSFSFLVNACKGTPSPARSPKVDVHAHFVPDFYADALREAGHTPGPDGMPGIPVSRKTLIAIVLKLTRISRAGTQSLIFNS
jgi:hypothetical protein